MALNELKKQMVIKLGITTNEDAQAISGMVDNAGGGGSMLITPIYFDENVLARIGGSTGEVTIATAEGFADFAQALDNGKPLQPVFVESMGDTSTSYFFGQSVQTLVTEQLLTRDIPLEGDYYYLEAGVKLYKIEDEMFITSFDLIKEGHNEVSPMD